MFAKLFRNTHSNHIWDTKSNHKTWRIRNFPININDEYILYSTDSKMGEDGIVLYDIQNDRFNDPIKYPSNIPKPEYHSYCKYKDADIYMFNPDGTIIIFNINNNTFTPISNIKNKQEIGRYASCFTLGDDLIHIIGGLHNKYDLIYSIKYNKYVQKQEFGVKIENPCIVKYIAENKVFMFSGYCTEKFFVGTIIHHNHHEEIKWELSQTMKIPNRLRDPGYILCKHYIILFGGNGGYNKEYSDHIYLINLKNNGKIEKLDDIQCPTKDKYHAVFIHHKIHLFGLFNEIQHYALSISNIFPDYDENEENTENKEDHDDHKQNVEENEEEKEEEEEEEEEKEEKKEEEVQENNNEYIDNLRKEIENKDERILSLENENKTLKLKMEEFRLRLIEYEYKINKYEEEKNNKNRLDLSKYKEWDSKKIVLWILTLENGLFEEYKTILAKTLEDNLIEGEDLKDINDHQYWTEYGINKFGLRKRLIKHIHALIKQNNHKQLNEGDDTDYV